MNGLLAYLHKLPIFLRGNVNKEKGARAFTHFTFLILQPQQQDNSRQPN